MNLDDEIKKEGDASNEELFLETNIGRLRLNPSLSEALRGETDSGVPGANGTTVEIDTVENGVPILSIQGNVVYPSEDPLGLVADQVSQVAVAEKTDIVVAFGLGLGYHVELMERRCDCPVVVFDPCIDALSLVLRNRPLPLSRTTLVTNFGHLLGEVQSRLQFTDRNLIVVAIPEYVKMFGDAFSKFRKMVEQALSNSSIMERTIVTLMKDWIKNSAKNLPEVAKMHPIDVYRDKFKGKPGILVSAGPSLDKNVEVLKEIKDNALVVAVNTSAKPLHHAGVVPDMVTIVESLDLSAHFRDIDWIDQVLLAPSMNCNEVTLGLPAKRVHPVADLSVPCSEWLTKAFGWHRFLAGGSVACTAFAILHELGCDPIILIGQDLAFTNGDTYADGAAFGRLKMKLDENGKTLKSVTWSDERESLMKDSGRELPSQLTAVQVEAWGGIGTVATTQMFTLFQAWFEAAADTWAGDRTLINATEGGVRLLGYEEMTLADVGSKWCGEPFDKEGLMQEALDEAPAPDMAVLVDIIGRDLERIEEMKNLADRTQQVAKKALTHLEQNSQTEAEVALLELETLENEIRADSKRSPLLDAYAGADLHRLRITRRNDEDDDPSVQTKNALRRSREIFAAISKNAVELKTLFTGVLEKIE